MADAEIASWEEVQRCPKCQAVGKNDGGVPIRQGRSRGGKRFTFQCKNPRCTWHESGWVVQVNPDGTIFQPRPQAKQYDDPGPLTQRGKEELQAAERALRSATRAPGGGVVRNR